MANVKKINFDNMNLILLEVNEDLGLEPDMQAGISPDILYSFQKYKDAKVLLDELVSTLKEWYKKVKSIENFIDNVNTIWYALLSDVAEYFLNDYIKYGILDYNNKGIANVYEKFRETFESGYSNVAVTWANIESELIENQAYRALKKETRSRVVGIGFGLTGGLKAAISSGLANAATGFAHDISNAAAESADIISKRQILDRIYNNEDTLKNFINGWVKTFWQIYDYHIQTLNKLVVEEGTSPIFNYSTLISFKFQADNKYQNLQKANFSPDEIHDVIIELIYLYPFETAYWHDYLSFIYAKTNYGKAIYEKIILFLERVGAALPYLYNALAPKALKLLLLSYIKNEKANKGSENEAIISLIRNSLAHENSLSENEKTPIDIMNTEIIPFKNIFKVAVENAFFPDSGVVCSHIEILNNLLVKLNSSIDSFLRDAGYNKVEYEHKMQIVSQAYIGSIFDTLIWPSLELGEIDKIVNEIKSKGFLNPEKTHYSIIYYVKEKLDKINYDNAKYQIIEQIDKLKELLGIESIIPTSEYYVIRAKLTPLQIKISMYNQLLKEIKREGKDYFDWEDWYIVDIPFNIEQNMRKNLEIENEEHIILMFDSNSSIGKNGLVLTADGFYWKDKDTEFHPRWINLAENFKLSIHKDSIYIEEKEHKNNWSLDFSDNAKNTSHLISNLLFFGCLIFAGITVDESGFILIPGVKYDITKLSTVIDDDIKEDISHKEDIPVESETSDNVTNKSPPTETVAQVINKSQERFNYLREDERIYIAKKFKERKGFFKHILPSSWILTVIFYLFIALVILFLAALLIPNTNETINAISGLFTLIIIPVGLLIFGIKKRVKYMREKKKWKECTDSGKRNINDVFKEFQEMENEYIGL